MGQPTTPRSARSARSACSATSAAHATSAIHVDSRVARVTRSTGSSPSSVDGRSDSRMTYGDVSSGSGWFHSIQPLPDRPSSDQKRA